MFVAGFLALASAQGVTPTTCALRPGEVLESSGTIDTGGLTGRLLRRVEAGTGRLFEEQDLGIVVTRTGFDGKVAWSQGISGGMHDLNSNFARRLAASIAWLDKHQGCSPSTHDGMRRLGSRGEGKRRFTEWEAHPTGGVPFELWYDTRNGRLDRAFFQMAESRLIRHFADWRDIGGGRLVAFLQRDEFPEDEDEAVRHFAKVTIHKSASLADFERPQRPEDFEILDGVASAVPFEDDHRTRIYIPVMLNGKGPFLFELDNGGHNILTKETAQALGLDSSGSFNSTGAGSAVAQSGIARVAEVRIGNARLRDQPFQVRKFSAASNDRSPGPPRAGILGLGLFERFAVAIDPRSKTVTLSLFNTADRPAGAAIPLVFTEDAPLIAGSFAGKRGDFMLDTGNAGPTIIEDYWARPLGMTSSLEKGVVRGSSKVSIGRVGTGPFELDDELVSYYGPAERGSEYTRAVAGIYGEPLLSRFRSTYDYSRKAVWLEPLPEVGPLPFDRSGLALVKAQGGLFRVSAVTPGGPADEAGLREGDLVGAIEGVAAPALSRADAACMFRQEAGTSIQLTGTFSGANGSKTLVLRDLLR